MSKFISKIIVLLILSMAVFPTQIYAEEPTPEPNPGCPENAENCGYVMLAPIFQEQVGKPVTMSDYLSKIYNILFLTAGIVATIMLIIGGFQYMISEVASTKAAAKDRMYNAIWGLLLAIFSYTILYTLNPQLLNVDFKLKKINLKPAPIVESTTPTDPTVPKEGNWPSDDAERAALPSGVTVNRKTSCKAVGEDPCTTIYGMPSHVFSKLGDLRNKAGTDIVITGGTEYWLHQSHGVGKAVVDISNKSNKLNDYILKNGVKSNVSCGLRNAPKYTLSNGIYVDEGNHWHVCY